MIDILTTVVGRRYFTLFLEPLQASGLIGFYTSVEELKHSNKSSYHQLGAEIFYTYIRAPSSPIKIDKVKPTNAMHIFSNTNRFFRFGVTTGCS